MSLFYILAVIGLWLWLGRLFWRFWRRTWQQTGTRGRCIITPLFALVAIAWLSASFWYGGGRKLYYDAEVRRLCAIDGGIKVYETVQLPPERFDSHGNIGVRIKGYEKLTDEYYYDFRDEYLKTDNPFVSRTTSRLIRRSDGKVLGESICYTCSTTHLLRPFWIPPSLFNCPPTIELNIETSIFKKEKMK